MNIQEEKLGYHEKLRPRKNRSLNKFKIGATMNPSRVSTEFE